MKPVHQKAKKNYDSGIFFNLNSFAELEQRISLIESDKDKGDVFEVFAEGYFATQRIYDVKALWPSNTAQLETITKLGLTENDFGVDGIYQSHLNHYSAYQVKFRSGRKALTWRELSTFIGLADSPRIRSRVLITNSDDIPNLLNERQGFFCIRGSDLDRLSVEDFKKLEAWLSASAYKVEKKKPLPHQQEALSNIVPALQINSRVSAIMACGTGKTLVALWVAEQLCAKQVIVLLPSLALLRQTLHEWLKETNLIDLTYLCVCSDATVDEGSDAYITRQSELDFEVNTRIDNVREFLDAPFSGVKVIFSTYQSARVIGFALKPDEFFDLGIFDEAHRTAGREGRNYGFALEDRNLPIKKRLFVTATPRHYNPHKRDPDGEAQLVFSMENPEVYGEQVYRLAFGEAARKQIICNYKVVISVVTSKMVTDELLSKGEVLVNGDVIRARQVANQIALRDAVEQYGVKKIFTFHKTVKSAASFVAKGNEGINVHLPDFETYHVNGEMPTSRREHLMRDFRNAKNAVMTNARCLTEGVDVPAVDMVAFLSPRRSRVDIVQATGRAMRRSDGKELGYVLVPLYLKQALGESIEDAVKRTEFDEIWDILQSLQEQDEVLADIISSYGEQKGQGKGFNDKGYADRIEFLGPLLHLDELKAAVTTRCLDGLYSSWDSWYGKLKSFKEQFGHCNVQIDYEDKQLGIWVSAQRNRRKKSSLTIEQIEKLDVLGFVWDGHVDNWEKTYLKLIEYKQKVGDCNVPIGWEQDKGLSQWVVSQRTKKNKNILADERVTKLEQIGFIWDFQSQKADETWMKWYVELEKYTQKHGNPHVTRTYTNTKLASWVWIQRLRKDKSYNSAQPLNHEQVVLLDKLNFYWDPHEERWQEKFKELQIFKEQHGHCQVEKEADTHKELCQWVNVQRRQKFQDKLAEKRMALLEHLDFSWKSSVLDDKWYKNYNELKTYYLKHGNADVPYALKENPRLAKWVSSLRARFKRNDVSSDQIALLNEVNFTWSLRDRGDWEDNLDVIVAFKQKYGHCNIPLNFPENPKLARFVNSSRVQRNKGLMSEDRIEKLDAVGFVWFSDNRTVDEDGLNGAWKKRYQEIVEYKKKFGDCVVKRTNGDYEQLANWVEMQRRLKKTGKLHPERVRLLNELDFAWLSPNYKGLN